MILSQLVGYDIIWHIAQITDSAVSWVCYDLQWLGQAEMISNLHVWHKQLQVRRALP